MSNMLIEKRAEFAAKLEALEAARKADIAQKLEAFRIHLEETTSREDIDKVKGVLNALDEVIQYESMSKQIQYSVPVQTEQVVSHADVETSYKPVEARPGMSNVFTPSRN